MVEIELLSGAHADFWQFFGFADLRAHDFHRFFGAFGNFFFDVDL